MSRIHNKRSDERGGINGGEKETNTGRGAEQSGEERSGPSKKTSVSQSGGAAAGLQQVFSILAGTASVCVKDG